MQVDSIKTLCLKNPSKYPALLNFLSAALRDEGGPKYKKALVDAIFAIIHEVKEAKETGNVVSLSLSLVRILSSFFLHFIFLRYLSGLEQFCEYIEDCEFPDLCIRILGLLGEEACK
jgi:coatomer protein complex subunit gamma